MHSLGSYDLRLVALSIVMAALACFTALDLAGRIRAALGWTRYAWPAAAHSPWAAASGPCTSSAC